MSQSSTALLVFGNQLFDPRYLAALKEAHVVMVEDEAFCRRYTWHRQKLVFVLAAMRSHADRLREAGFKLHYHRLEDGMTWQSALDALRHSQTITALCHFELESPGLSRAVAAYARGADLTLDVRRTLLFINTLDEFDEHLEREGSPKLLPYYQAQRQRHDVLMTADGSPVGGRWSFDQDNRAKLPKDVEPEAPRLPDETAHVKAVKSLVAERFSGHPGDTEEFWVPTTHAQAEDWLDDFLTNRFGDFGTYEDALTRRSTFAYHSALSPLLNVGLLTPQYVLDRALRHAASRGVAVNSVEGFVRQILGWREFVRGVFHRYDDPLLTRNIWNADRRLTDAWYQGTTGIDPLDHVIRKAGRLAWAHHIERLMIVANLMNLSGIAPQEVYRWFMEMFVDAYDWVMVPNVFGMGLTSEGGIFTTKPYICGSNYVLKMGDFKRGDWCEVMDGLLWRFVARHEPMLKMNQRLAPMVANLPRVSRRRPHIFPLAEQFIETHTASP